MNIVFFILLGIIAAILVFVCIALIPLVISSIINNWAELIETIEEHLQ